MTSLLWYGLGLYIIGIVCTIAVLAYSGSQPRLETKQETERRQELRRVLDRMREGRY